MAADKPLVTGANRGLRYGYGCFETMRINNHKLCLRDHHFGRLFSSLEHLGLHLPVEITAQTLEEQVIALALKNGHAEQGRARLNFFGGEGGLYPSANEAPHYIIETGALEETAIGFNQQGLHIDIYRDARKAADQFSHIKHNNFLPYAMAARWAADHDLDDAILLNCEDRVADTTIANVFIVQDGLIKTPVLTEGCVSGVMRKYLVNRCRKEGIPVEETRISADDLAQASELFLTNALRGIRWVQQAGDTSYTCQVSKLLYRKFINPLWC